MKKLISVCVVLLFLIMSVQAQQQSRRLVTEEELANMNMEQLRAYQQVLQQTVKNNIKLESPINKMSKLEEYAFIGKSFGQAFKECWSTVSTDVEKFSQTPAGKWTAFLISWKIMGQDAISLTKQVVRWGVGSCLLFVGTLFTIYTIRKNCLIKSHLVKVEQTGFFKKTKTYSEPTTPEHYDSIWIYWIAYGIFFLLLLMIMFA